MGGAAALRHPYRCYTSKPRGTDWYRAGRPSSRRRPGDTPLPSSRGPDRKSVVSGKRVSGRVDLGGSPIITKKTTHKTTLIHLKNRVHKYRETYRTTIYHIPH